MCVVQGATIQHPVVVDNCSNTRVPRNHRATRLRISTFRLLYYLPHSFRSFRLFFAGDMSRDVPNGASAAEFQAALMSIKQDQASSSAGGGGGETVSVTVSLDPADSPGALAWRVTFLSHLEASPSFSCVWFTVLNQNAFGKYITCSSNRRGRCRCMPLVPAPVKAASNHVQLKWKQNKP